MAMDMRKCGRLPCDGPDNLMGFIALQEGQAKTVLSEEVLSSIVGEGARDRGGKGNANAGDGGVAFVLTSASAVPGSPDLVCMLPPCTLLLTTPHQAFLSWSSYAQSDNHRHFG